MECVSSSSLHSQSSQSHSQQTLFSVCPLAAPLILSLISLSSASRTVHFMSSTNHYVVNPSLSPTGSHKERHESSHHDTAGTGAHDALGGRDGLRHGSRAVWPWNSRRSAGGLDLELLRCGVDACVLAHCNLRPQPRPRLRLGPAATHGTYSQSRAARSGIPAPGPRWQVYGCRSCRTCWRRLGWGQCRRLG